MVNISSFITINKKRRIICVIEQSRKSLYYLLYSYCFAYQGLTLKSSEWVILEVEIVYKIDKLDLHLNSLSRRTSLKIWSKHGI